MNATGGWKTQDNLVRRPAYLRERNARKHSYELEHGGLELGFTVRDRRGCVLPDCATVAVALRLPDRLRRRPVGLARSDADLYVVDRFAFRVDHAKSK